MENNNSFDGKKIKNLVIGIVVVLVMLVLVPIMYSQIGETTSLLQYGHGDVNLESSTISTTAVLTCTEGNMHPLCGEDKFTGVSGVLSILPIVIAASVIALGGWWAVSSYRNGGGGNNAMFITGGISAAVVLLIALIVIPITFTPLEDAILSARDGGYTAAVPLLELVPLVLIVGSIAVGALLTGVVGKRSGSMMS